MEENFSECSTGILIDIEDHRNVAVDTETHCDLDKTTIDAKKSMTGFLIGIKDCGNVVVDTESHSNLDKTTSDAEECMTGILIDIKDKGNVAVDTESHCDLDKTTNDVEKVLDLDDSEASSCVTDRVRHINLGDELDAKKEMLSIPRAGWKTPSPKSMDKIWKEAHKIIDQLHSSPIENTEALLIDEDFPVSEEGCFNESSPESEKGFEKNEDSITGNTAISSLLKEDCMNEPLPESEKESPKIENSLKDCCSTRFPTNEDCLDESLKESRNISERNEDCPPIIIPMVNTSCIDAQTSPTEVFNTDISGVAKVKLYNPVTENITQSNKLSKPIELVSELKTAPGNAFKTPIKISNKINKENGSHKKTLISSGVKFPQSDKKNLKRDILGDSNKKRIGIIKSAPNEENSLKKNLKNAIPEKINTPEEVKNKNISNNSLIGTNRRNIVSRTPSAVQYQSVPRQKLALCKTSSVVETPNIPKFIRRANSFQTQIGRNSTIKRPEKSFEQKSSISAKESVKTCNLKTPSEPSMKLEKSRMSISRIPSNVNTPLKRSNSLSKKSGFTRSQIPGPSISLTSRKTSPVAENSQHRLERPVVSTSSRVRVISRLSIPSALPKEMDDKLPRNLFPDLKAPRKK